MMKSIHYVLCLTVIYALPKTRSYVDNGDGTISDEVTGLMWQQSMGDKIIWQSAMDKASSVKTGDYSDWRMPSLKELFSLIMYSGQVNGSNAVTMFIDTEYFEQPLGNTSVPKGREIDAQTWSDVAYNGSIQDTDTDHSFGVNFVDGRVKCYPQYMGKYARYVRGNSLYAVNQFQDNGDGTISDTATGLMWSQMDSGMGLDWREALAFCENYDLAGHTDWRLPTIKELNSIVDYSKGQGYAAINETVFNITMVPDPDGNTWWPYFWSSTTLLDGMKPGDLGVYQTFGRALGILQGTLMDAHGAGAIRGDPKSGNKSDYPSHGNGFQGDVQYVYNYVRPVRDIASSDDDGSLTYPIVETNVTLCYDDHRQMSCPVVDQPFYGQNGDYVAVSYNFVSGGSTGGSSDTGLIVGLTLTGIVVITIAAWCWYDTRKKKFAAGEGGMDAKLLFDE